MSLEKTEVIAFHTKKRAQSQGNKSHIHLHINTHLTQSTLNKMKYYPSNLFCKKDSKKKKKKKKLNHSQQPN